MLPGDRLFCIFVEDLQVGTTFSRWYLHATIVPWFRSEMANAYLCAKLKTTLSGLNPFHIAMGGEAGFGHHGHELVNLVRLPSPIQSMEHAARGILNEPEVWIVDETTKFKRTFRPHVTTQASQRLYADDTFACASMYIVEQKGDYKEIVSKIQL